MLSSGSARALTLLLPRAVAAANCHGSSITSRKMASAADPPGVAGGDGVPVPAGPVVIREGKARMEFENQAAVFYNPVQEFNRDLSIAVIQQYVNQTTREQENGSRTTGGIRLLEGLSASGLRSIRYAKEITGLSEIVANDISRHAVNSIERNVVLNDVASIVTPSHNDASMAMYLSRKSGDRFNIIDLDPYGSAAPFLDAAVQSTADGGLICVTCTDMAVLCGNAAETCYTKYKAICLKSKCCHEMALRIVLQSIESHANRYGRHIKPLVSLSIDFYCRVFVTIHTSQKECKLTTSKVGHVYQCTGCESMTVQPLGKIVSHEDGKNIRYKLCTGPPVGPTCRFCDRSHHVGGPFWLAPIHDPVFLERLLGSLDEDEERFGTFDRMKGMLSVASEELHDVPFYYTQDRLCAMVRAGSGKLVEFRSALLNAGYRVSLSHAHKLALKTDAPNEFIWDMMREWEALHPVNRSKLAEDSVAMKILSRPWERNKISFQIHPDANPASRTQQLKRFQLNPEKNWGPKTRAAAGTFDDDRKRERNQGKKRKKKDEEVEKEGGEGEEEERNKRKMEDGE